jgi:hypothetical protein
LPTLAKSIAGRRFVEFTTHALASRLIASWMEAKVTKASTTLTLAGAYQSFTGFL